MTTANMMHNPYDDPLVKAIRALEHVADVNYWEKGEHKRMYIRVASQNRFPNTSNIWIDMTDGTLHVTLEKGKSGAKSHAWAQEVVRNITALLAE